MALIDFYKWCVGSQTHFIDSFPAATQDIAEIYWRTLDQTCIVFIACLVLVSVVGCVSYFTWYNSIPGRHYKVSHWIFWYLGSVLLVLLGTAMFGYIFANPTIQGAKWLIWKFALGNAAYSFAIYGVLSVIWWLFLPTNAYRLIGNR